MIRRDGGHRFRADQGQAEAHDGRGRSHLVAGVPLATKAAGTPKQAPAVRRLAGGKAFVRFADALGSPPELANAAMAGGRAAGEPAGPAAAQRVAVDVAFSAHARAPWEKRRRR